MIQIFLSHSMHDREWCEWLKANAAEMGINAYLSEHNPSPGKNLAEKIIAAINASEAVVVLIAQNSDGSQWVHQEIGCAVHAKKLIIPLVQPGIASETLAMLQGLSTYRSTLQIRTKATCIFGLRSRS